MLLPRGCTKINKYSKGPDLRLIRGWVGTTPAYKEVHLQGSFSVPSASCRLFSLSVALERRGNDKNNNPVYVVGYIIVFILANTSSSSSGEIDDGQPKDHRPPPPLSLLGAQFK